MDVELAKPFVNATQQVLSTMAMMQCKAGKPFVKKDSSAMGDVTGIVGLTGDKSGTFSISFSKSCGIAVVKNMLGEDIQDIVNDVKDAVGEVTNMISGAARAELQQNHSLTISGSTPSVVMGANHTIAHVSKEPIMAVPFSTEHGDFVIECCFE